MACGVPVCAAPGFLVILIALAMAKIGIIKKCQTKNSSVADPIDCLGEAFYWLTNFIPAKSTKKFLIKNMIPMFYHLAKSSGHISSEEIKHIDKWMREDLLLSSAEREKAIKLFRSSRQSERDYLIFARNLKDELKKSPAMLKEAVEALLKVASADGIITAGEEKLVQKAAAIFGFSERKFQALLRNYNSQKPAIEHKITQEVNLNKRTRSRTRLR